MPRQPGRSPYNRNRGRPTFSSRSSAIIFLVIATLAASLSCAAAAPKKWRVALVLPGSISDKGFNEVAYQGLQQIHQTLGAEISFSENTPMTNYERVIRGFAEEGNDIIICRGLEFDDVVQKIAPDYPKQIFIVSDGHDLSGRKLRFGRAAAPATPLFSAASLRP